MEKEHHISAVIITLNEERNIARVIDSLQGIADEILVYDSHSTDKTAEICKEKDVRFIQDEWLGYSETKNKANQLAKHRYIFSIDADEALSEELRKSLLKVKEEGLEGYYSMNRLTNYCGKWIRHSGWYPDVKVRLFPKDQVYWEGKWVHETLHIPGSLNKVHLKGDLLHYSYYNFKDHRQKADHYSELTANKMFEKGKTSGPLKPYLSGLARFISMYIFKLGFLDGKMGFKIAQISAASNVYKYKKLRALHHREK